MSHLWSVLKYRWFMSEKYLVVGLGNPGRKYQSNRHNIGFNIVSHLAERHSISSVRMQDGAFVSTGTVLGKPVIITRPQTYMNKSGGPVSTLVKFYRIPLENLIVVYDDLDLPAGTIRLRPEGGAGGQNGMRSIIERLGTQVFARLRVGIDRPPGRMDPAAYVLRDFSADQQPVIEQVLDRASDAVEMWLTSGIELAMSRFNGPLDRE